MDSERRENLHYEENERSIKPMGVYLRELKQYIWKERRK